MKVISHHELGLLRPGGFSAIILPAFTWLRGRASNSKSYLLMALIVLQLSWQCNLNSSAALTADVASTAVWPRWQYSLNGCAFALMQLCVPSPRAKRLHLHLQENWINYIRYDCTCNTFKVPANADVRVLFEDPVLAALHPCSCHLVGVQLVHWKVWSSSTGEKTTIGGRDAKILRLGTILKSFTQQCSGRLHPCDSCLFPSPPALQSHILLESATSFPYIKVIKRDKM